MNKTYCVKCEKNQGTYYIDPCWYCVACAPIWFIQEKYIIEGNAVPRIKNEVILCDECNEEEAEYWDKQDKAWYCINCMEEILEDKRIPLISALRYANIKWGWATIIWGQKK
jgi:hypothetical protein